MKLAASLVAVGLLSLLPARAHDVITTKLTYARDIKPILARRCSECHSAGTSIPLARYAEARPWAVSIKEQVLSRKMPPWGAVKGFGDLSPDLGLTEEEILIIAAWVVGGAPEGSESRSPTEVVPHQKPIEKAFSSESTVQTNLRFSKPFLLAAIRPNGDASVSSTKIIAVLPGGQVKPLLWLFNYDPKWRRTFWLRQPVLLPSGSSIRASSPLRFSILSTT